MSSVAEILIIRGLMPIESLDDISGDPATDELHILSLIDTGVLTDVQVASARAAQAGLPFVELIDYPIDRTAVSLVSADVVETFDRHEATNDEDLSN